MKLSLSNTVILVLATLLTVALGQKGDLCTRLMKKCDLRIKGYMNRPGTFWMGKKTDRAFTPKFVTGNNNGFVIREVNSGSRVPDFIFKKGTGPITKYGFGPEAFKPFPIGNFSGIGRQALSKQQIKSARSRCIRVWISHFQLYLPNGELLNFIRDPPAPSDCVVFRTK